METPRTVEEPSWKHALRLWWSFTWRWPLLILIPLLPIAIVVALVKPAPETALRLARWVAWPLTFWAQITACRQLLRIDYKGFSVRVIERKSVEE